jgi:hypothetical protein
VAEEGVGDPSQPRAGLVVVERDRLVRDVPAREDERPAEVRREQMVDGRVRKHQAEPVRARRDRIRDRCAGAPANEHDRPLARAEQIPLLGLELGQRVGRGREDGERLLLALLARAQPSHRLLVCRVAGEVVAAEALDGDDPAGAEQRHGVLQRQREPRAAGRARVRLGVEAAVGGIPVLAETVRAHRKAGHRRVRAVVRNGADDREPGSALRAVDERIAVPAVRGIEELAQAVVARRHVGRDQRRAAARGARRHREALLSTRRERLRRHRLDARERRGLGAQRSRERVERQAFALGLDHDPAAVVQHEAAELVPPCEPVHERPEADALHDAPNAKSTTLSRHAPSVAAPPARAQPRNPAPRIRGTPDVGAPSDCHGVAGGRPWTSRQA